MKLRIIQKKTHNVFNTLFLTHAFVLLVSCNAKLASKQQEEQVTFNPQEPKNYASVFEDKSLAQISSLLSTSQSQSLIEFDIIDASTRKAVLHNISDGQTIYLKELPPKLTIEVRVAKDIGEKSVKISFGKVRKTENEAPYTIFGDNERVMNSKAFPIGDVVLSATAHEKVRATGKALAAAQIKINILNTARCTTASCDEPVGSTTGDSTTDDSSTGGSTTGGSDSENQDSNEVNGVVHFEMENSTTTDSNWAKETFLGKEMLVWRGSNYYNNAVAPNSARIVRNFKLNRCGTFKLVVHAARDLDGRPAPADGEDCNAPGSFCIHEENDVSVGMEQASTTIQGLEKVYMHFFYYNDPTRMQVFPIGEWASGGRVDRPTRQLPLYKITKLDDLKLIVAPRSKNFMIDALELQRVDDAACESDSGGLTTGGDTGSTTGGSTTGGSTTGGSTGSEPGELGTLSSVNAAIERPLIYFGKYKRDADGNILKDSSGNPLKTNGGCNDCQGLGAGVALAANSHAGDTRTDARLLENIRYILIPGREPGFNGGYNSQHEVTATSMFTIAKHTDRVWNQLSSNEKAKINALMKASLVANAFTSDSSNSGYGIDGDSNIYLGGNPNYRQGMIGSLIVAVSYFGANEADRILKNHNHAGFINELKALGNVNTVETWTFNPPSGYTNNSPRGAWKKPSASDIETKISSFEYKYKTGERVNGKDVEETVKLNEVSKLFKAITDRTYRVAIACGLNDGAGRTGGCGRVESDCDTLPNKGELAAIVEFASGDRSSVVYAYDVFKANQAILLAMISAKLFNKAEIGNVLDRNIMGNDDVFEKLKRGYINSKEGKACSEQSTWRLSDTGKSFEVNFPAWQEILKPYLLGSGGTTGGTSTGGSTSGAGLACSNGMLDGESKTIYIWDSLTVIKPATCGAGTPFVTERCINGNIVSASLPLGKVESCQAIDDPNSCLLEDKVTRIANGSTQTQTLYATDSVPKGSICNGVVQTRTCNNGVLSNYLPATSFNKTSCFEEGDDEVPADSSCKTGRARAIKQAGVTWEFSSEVECGHYTNGDYWVKAPATVTAITGTSGGGSMLNPIPGGLNGWDTRANDTTRKYDASLDVSKKLPLNLAANDALVTAKSYGSGVNWLDNYDTPLEAIVVLTAVSSKPAPGSFRPAFFRSSHNQFNKNNIHWSKLKNLARTPNSPVSVDESYNAMSALPWVDWCGSWVCKKFMPKQNTITENYGREIAKNHAKAALTLNLNFPQKDKEKLAVRLIQKGIDIYGYLKNGQKFDPDGGHKHGRKMPILMAAVLLNDSELLSYASNSRLFQEDMQTWIVSQEDVGRKLSSGKSGYNSGHVGMAEWGVRHGTRPAEDNSSWDANYRTVNGASTIGSVLAARIMGIEAQWNWDPTFKYWDRYYSIEAKNAGYGANSMSRFVDEMWKAYRGTNP